MTSSLRTRSYETPVYMGLNAAVMVSHPFYAYGTVRRRAVTACTKVVKFKGSRTHPTLNSFFVTYPPIKEDKIRPRNRTFLDTYH